MNTYPIQQSIVQRLQQDFIASNTTFIAKDHPDSESLYETGLRVPVSYVCYMGSQADPSINANVIAQPRKLKFNVNCHGRTLMGPSGLFVVRDIIEQSLIGFKPLNSQRLYLLRDDIGRAEEDGIWIHVFQFECTTMLVQKDETEPIIVPEFHEIVSGD